MEEQIEKNQEEDNQTEKTQAEVSEEVITVSIEELKKIRNDEKKSGRRQGFLISFIIVLVVVGAIFSVKTVVDSVKSIVYPSKTIVNEDVEKKANNLWGMIDRYFLWDADKDAAVEGMYDGMLESLGDPYSCYYTKQEMDSLLESASGHYSGIGAYVALDEDIGVVYISKPMPGSPAEEAGLLPDDHVYEIDGEDVTGLELDVVVSKIKGPEGSNVVLGIRRDNETELRYITITRRTIEVNMLEYDMIGDDIGYIWLYEFEQVAIDQFDKAYDDLKGKGMKGLIIDLRDNPGGDLDAVVRLADKFLPEGIVCYTKDKDGNGSKYKSDAEYEDIPIVIITNGNSASASEILSGSLKDRGVATIVGKNTFGKGIVQSLFSLSDGTGLKVTESEYYLPNDECIHGVGIAPDVEVDLDIEAYREKKIDAQKDKAIEVLKEKMKK